MTILRIILSTLLFPLVLNAAPQTFTEERNVNDPARMLIVRLTLDATEIKLSGEAKLTLVAEGPGPLELSTGKTLLDGPLTWRVRDEGPFPRELLADGRERVTKTFRLSPMIPGSVAITLNPLRCRTGTDPEATITFKPVAMQVTTSAGLSGIDSLRPNTGIEHIADTAKPQAASGWWALLILPVILGFSFWLFRRPRPTRGTPMDAQRLLRELEQPGLDTERLTEVLRDYLAFRFAIPTRQSTTPELIGRLRSDETLSAAMIDRLESSFGSIDSQRFTGRGQVPDETINEIRHTVEQIELRLQPSSEKHS